MKVPFMCYLAELFLINLQTGYYRKKNIRMILELVDRSRPPLSSMVLNNKTKNNTKHNKNKEIKTKTKQTPKKKKKKKNTDIKQTKQNKKSVILTTSFLWHESEDIYVYWGYFKNFSWFQFYI